MGLLGNREIGSPQQKHHVQIANDVMWIAGELETLGNPHNYINQDGLEYMRVNEPHIAPWAFTGLPSSHVPFIITTRERIQLLNFPGEEAIEQFRQPMRTEPLIVNIPLAVIRGNVPFLSEAQIHNFLDFWKGIFFPVIDAELYFLADGPAEQPTQAALVYVNRNVIQSYLEG